MADQQIGDGGGLLDGGEVRGAGDQGEPGVGYPGDQDARVGGRADLVLGADEHQGRHADAAEFRADVEGGQGLAGGDIAAGVGGTDHLYGPLHDRGLGRGEAGGEPALRRGAGDRVEPVRTDDDAALPPGVRGAEPGGGGDEGERGEAVRVAQGEVGADGPADRAADVAESVDAELVEGDQQPVGEIPDGGGGVRGRAAVAGQVEAEHAPVAGQLRDLPIPHMPRRPEGGPHDQDRGLLRPVTPVLQGFSRRLAHAPHAFISHNLSQPPGCVARRVACGTDGAPGPVARVVPCEPLDGGRGLFGSGAERRPAVPTGVVMVTVRSAGTRGRVRPETRTPGGGYVRRRVRPALGPGAQVPGVGPGSEPPARGATGRSVGSPSLRSVPVAVRRP